MRLPLSLVLLCLSAISAAQSTTAAQPSTTAAQPSTTAAQNQTANSPSPILSTSLSTSVGLGNNRQSTTEVFTNVITLQQPATTNVPAANSTSGNNATVSTTSSTQTSNLPTANPNVAGGGNAGGAPLPGGGNGIYGPGDGYVAGALALKVNAALVVLAGVSVGVWAAL